MLKVILKSGKIVSIPNATYGEFSYAQDEKMERTRTEIGATLIIKEAATYGSKIIATFDKAEVVGFYNDSEIDETKES